MSSFWTDEVNEDQISFDPYFIAIDGKKKWSIRDHLGELVGSIEVEKFAVNPLYPTSGMGRVEPGNLSYVSVKEIEIYRDEEAVTEFLSNFFLEVRNLGGEATWYPDKDLEDGEPERYKAHDNRDKIEVKDLDSLVEVYGLLDDYSGLYWMDDVEYGLDYEKYDFPDEFGLASYIVYYTFHLPPEIVLDPQTWAGLVKEAVGEYEYIDPLVEVPQFIMKDQFQIYQGVGSRTKTRSHEQWIRAGGKGYMSEVAEAIIFNTDPEDADAEWAEELLDKIYQIS